jgi:hypothetical protein
MPSPFPGMDPYLEKPGLSRDVRHGFISTAQDLLNAQLRPTYFVRIGERAFIDDELVVISGAGYDLEIDYRKEPDPPLDAELAAWADDMLRSKGLR